MNTPLPQLTRDDVLDGREVAELLHLPASTVLECPNCKGTMKLLAVVTDATSIQRMLRHLGEATDPPAREPARGPPYWKSRVLRRSA